MLSQFKKRPAVLYFTDTIVQCAKLDSSGSRFVFFGEYALPAGVIVSGEIKQPEILSQILKTLFAQKRIKDRLFIIGISDHKATIETVTVPVTKKDELQEAIIHQSSTFLPFPIEDQYFDWKILSTTKTETTVLFCSVPKSVLDGYTGVLSSLKCKPLAFENRSLTVLRLLKKPYSPFTIAVNVGHTDSTVMCIVNNMPYSTTVIPIRNDYLPRLQKTISYYVEKSNAQNLQKQLFVMGKNAQVVIQSQIPASLGVSAVPLFANIKNIDKSRQTELAILSALARGAVALPSDPKSIMLLPTALVDEITQKINKRVTKTLLGVFLFASIILAFVSVHGFITASAQYKNARNSIITVQNPTEKNKPSFPTAKMNLLSAISTFNPRYEKAIDTIEKVSNTDNIILSGIQVKTADKTILVIGTGQSRNKVIAYHENLEKTGLFKEVSLPLSAFIGDLSIPFRMTVTL